MSQAHGQLFILSFINYRICTLERKPNRPTHQVRLLLYGLQLNIIIKGPSQLSPMIKQVILIMQGNQYPFGQADESSTQARPSVQVRTLVRKIYETRSLQDRNQILDKIYSIKSISHPHLMRIETVLEEENCVHVLYEYVSTSFLRRIRDFQEGHIEQIRNNVLDLGAALAEFGLVVEWELKNIGITDKMETKYYLDLEKAKLDKKMSSDSIQKLHVQSIMGLFSQFLVLASGSPKSKPTSHVLHSSVLENKKPAGESKELSHSLAPKKVGGVTGTQTLKTKTTAHQQKKQSKHSHNRQQEINHLLIEQEIKKPLSKSKTDWKQIDDQSEFVQQFLNVLDDKSQNAESKYISDEENEQQKGLKKSKRQPGPNQSHENQSQNQEQEIIWESEPPVQSNPRQSGYQTQNMEEDGDEQVVWVDYRDFRDITERAYASMRKSMDALQMFRTIIGELEESTHR